MTTYAFPSITPSSSAWRLISNTGAFVSPMTGAVQTLDRGGERWSVAMTFKNLTAADKAVMQAFLVRLNGQQHRFTMQDHSRTQRGAFGGTPLVQGGSQTGLTLSIDGASASVTNWIRAGDMVGFDGTLKMAVLDANSSGGGAVTLTLSPRIVNAPPNNEPIVTTNPTGLFMLADSQIGWSNRAGNFGDFTINAIEDILA